MNNISHKHLIATIPQKILHFLIKYPAKSFLEKEIARGAKTKKSATNTALKELAADGLIMVEKKGRVSLYSVDLADPLIRLLKIENNLISIRSLVNQLKGISEKIILFGSAAEGTNLEDSDFDLFIITQNQEKARQVVEGQRLEVKFQLVIKKSADLPMFIKKEEDFYGEIEKGFVLYEKKDES